MVVMFMLYNIKKTQIKLSLVYDKSLNDDKKNVREIFIRERILEEYLFLKSIENDKDKILKMKFPNSLITENFYEKYTL